MGSVDFNITELKGKRVATRLCADLDSKKLEEIIETLTAIKEEKIEAELMAIEEAERKQKVMDEVMATLKEQGVSVQDMVKHINDKPTGKRAPKPKVSPRHAENESNSTQSN